MSGKRRKSVSAVASSFLATTCACALSRILSRLPSEFTSRGTLAWYMEIVILQLSFGGVSASFTIEQMSLQHPQLRLWTAPTRLHVCWGNYEGPHTFDVPLKRFGRPSPTLATNTNTVFESFELPDGGLLLARVIDTTTNYVVHSCTVASNGVVWAGHRLLLDRY